MHPDDGLSNPLLRANIHTACAADVAAHLKALRELDIPAELAEQLTRDYHAALLAWITNTPFQALISAAMALKDAKP